MLSRGLGDRMTMNITLRTRLSSCPAPSWLCASRGIGAPLCDSNRGAAQGMADTPCQTPCSVPWDQAKPLVTGYLGGSLGSHRGPPELPQEGGLDLPSTAPRGSFLTAVCVRTHGQGATCAQRPMSPVSAEPTWGACPTHTQLPGPAGGRGWSPGACPLTTQGSVGFPSG